MRFFKNRCIDKCLCLCIDKYLCLQCKTYFLLCICSTHYRVVLDTAKYSDSQDYQRPLSAPVHLEWYRTEITSFSFKHRIHRQFTAVFLSVFSDHWPKNSWKNYCLSKKCRSLEPTHTLRICISRMDHLHLIFALLSVWFLYTELFEESSENQRTFENQDRSVGNHGWTLLLRWV